MKKIMFSDRFGLTQAVLDGRKTMTRRMIKTPKKMEGKDVYGFAVAKRPGSDEWIEVMALDEDEGMINNILPKYKPGEVVAVAQSYGTIVDALEDPRNFVCMEHWESASGDRAKYAELAIYSPGGSNKMFVCADEMPHQIRIMNVRVERLQDISDEDCVKEGIWEAQQVNYTSIDGIPYSPREAFAALIDKVSGKGTWSSNPFVFVYEFELVK